MRTIANEHGEAVAQQVVGLVLTQADQMCGGRCTEDQLVELTKAIYFDYLNYSVETIALAIRRGITSSKVYGQLTYDQLAKWINDQIAEVTELNQDHYLAHRAKG